METILLSGAAVIGQGLLTSAISDLYGTIKTSTKNSYFSKLIDELDIKVDLEIIEALMKDIEKKQKENKDFIEKNVIDISMKHIHEIITKIKNEIEKVNLKIIDEHYSKYYFYSWSKTEYDINIKNIKFYKILLNKRVDTLFKILSTNL